MKKTTTKYTPLIEEKGAPLNQINLSEEEKEMVKPYHFLTSKPFFCLFNYSGNRAEIKKITQYTQARQIVSFPLALKLEIEIKDLSPLEKEELGFSPTNFSFLSEKIKQLLKLKIFFTAGEKETRSW